MLIILFWKVFYLWHSIAERTDMRFHIECHKYESRRYSNISLNNEQDEYIDHVHIGEMQQQQTAITRLLDVSGD